METAERNELNDRYICISQSVLSKVIVVLGNHLYDSLMLHNKLYTSFLLKTKCLFYGCLHHFISSMTN